MNYQLAQSGVILIPDEGKRRFIPSDPGNRDWLGYQRWIALGNTPLPDESAAREQSYHDEQRAVEQEIDTNLPAWSVVSGLVDDAFQDLKQRAIIKKLARIVYVSIRRKLT